MAATTGLPPRDRQKMRRRVVTNARRAALGVLVLSAAAVAVFALEPGPKVPDARPARVETAPQPSVDASEATAAIVATASAEPAAPTVDIVIAWQPSHQADTGADGWQEYVVCGDIVDRTMTAMPEWTHIKAWDLTHGLTGSNSYRPKPVNTPAFDAEVALANAGAADVFISIHNDGGAPSGVLGIYLPGDASSGALAAALKDALVAGTGLPDRGVTEMRLYSLESERNSAPYRCLLEIGDNEADRAYLESAEGRQQIAAALASGMRAYFGREQ